MKFSTFTISRSLNPTILLHCCSWLLLLFMMVFSTTLKAQMIPYSQLNSTTQAYPNAMIIARNVLKQDIINILMMARILFG